MLQPTKKVVVRVAFQRIPQALTMLYSFLPASALDRKWVASSSLVPSVAVVDYGGSEMKMFVAGLQTHCVSSSSAVRCLVFFDVEGCNRPAGCVKEIVYSSFLQQSSRQVAEPFHPSLQESSSLVQTLASLSNLRRTCAYILLHRIGLRRIVGGLETWDTAAVYISHVVAHTSLPHFS